MFKVLGRRVVVKPNEKAETVSPGGIVIPAQFQQVAEVSGSVVAVSPTVQNVKVGDVIFFSPHSGCEINVDKQRFLILLEEQVLAVME